MKLSLVTSEATRATLLINNDPESMVTVRCQDADKIAKQIRDAVNHNHLFDPMVTVLTPFKSNEMGQMLVDLILADAPPGVSDSTMNEVHDRLQKLVRAIDVILKGVELQRNANAN